MSKLLLLDIDGTLLNSKKELPASAKNALFKARENGHELAIATGRGPFMFEQLRKDLDIKTFISFNGQFVVHNGELIHKEAINPETLHSIVEFADRKDHPLVFMTDTRMVSSIDFHPNIDEGLKTLNFPHPQTEQGFYAENEIFQTLLFCEESEEQQYRETFKEVDLIRWHRVSCDVLPKHGSKARGIERLIRATGHSIEDTIAFGDGLNDLQMMEIAGISVAMENGHEKTKEQATYITDHVDQDGLAKAFSHFALI